MAEKSRVRILMFVRTTTILTLAAAMFGGTSLAEGDKQDDSTKVAATFTIAKELASFTDRTLELRLYEYDPFLADVGADLVEKISKTSFSHKR